MNPDENGLKWEERDGWITIALSESFLEETKGIVFLELPETEAEIKQGDSLFTLETVKEVRVMDSPVAIKVTERNQYWLDNPEMIKKEFQKSPWLLKGEVLS